MARGATGSVYQRGDGRWVAAITLGGKRIVRYGKTEREARLALRALVGEQERGTLAAPTKITVREWVEQWLEQQALNKRPSTVATYAQVLGPLLARVGHVRLHKLTPAILSAAFVDLGKAKLGTRRVQQAYVVLGTALRAAERIEVIGRNPLERVAKPRHEPGEMRLWTAEQTRAFITEAVRSRHRHAGLFLVMVCTGLRVGEALGLRWSDVDLATRTIMVRQALVFTGAQASVVPPKSRAGTRKIALPDVAVRELEGMPHPLDSDLPVFVNSNGNPPPLSNLRGALHRLCDNAGVPRIHVHGLRHVHASLLLAGGADVRSVQRRMGHSQPSVTLNVYSYALRSDESVVGMFDQMFGT